MRIVQAQEAERSRLAQEVHDGPAQALSNAIFQVEYIERVLDEDVRMAGSELRFLRELLRRELGEVRTFISQLRPPLLDELGLDGSIMDAVESMAALTGATVETDLQGSGRRAQLRLSRRPSCGSSRKRSRTSANTPARVAPSSRHGSTSPTGSSKSRTTAAASMSARSPLEAGAISVFSSCESEPSSIGAQFEVRSRPGGGTVVRLSIPVGEESE